jgi:hypothetical protein
MNQLFVMAIAEKVSALETAELSRKQAESAGIERTRQLLTKIPDRPVEKKDYE